MVNFLQKTMPNRGPGRPREFDMEAALDSAVLVFRERGYHAASVGDLGQAMKLTAGSIYKAFADKRAIFLAALDRYTTQRSAQLGPLLDAQPNGLDKVHAMLRFYAEASHDTEGRTGCLVVGSAVALGTFDAEVAVQVAAALQRIEISLRDLIWLGQSDGSISSSIDVDVSASILLCVLQGFRVIGKTGRTRADMMAAADQALRLLA